jgi:hypothetical protein
MFVVGISPIADNVREFAGERGENVLSALLLSGITFGSKHAWTTFIFRKPLDISRFFGEISKWRTFRMVQ